MLFIACLFSVVAVAQVSAGMEEDDTYEPEQGEEIEYPSDDYDSGDQGSEEFEDGGMTEDDSYR